MRAPRSPQQACATRRVRAAAYARVAARDRLPQYVTRARPQHARAPREGVPRRAFVAPCRAAARALQRARVM
eukprot:11165772-Lingulodinium_polyedra.AAC.1